MERTILEIEFLTPCFLGGSDPSTVCEWRGSSVRGQLRWWFRAIAGGVYSGNLRKVSEAESEIFGSTGQASPLQTRALGTPRGLSAKEPQPWGRGLMDHQVAKTWGLQPSDPDWQTALRRLQLPWPTNPLLYLGYGCLEYLKGKNGKVGLARPCLTPGETARLGLHWLRPLAPELQALWWDALWAWIHLGGIGSRCRRGFGSLRVKGADNVPEDWLSIDRASFAEKARGLLKSARPDGKAPSWTHFSTSSAIYIAHGPGHASWEEAMVHSGAWLMAFRRRYGSPADVRSGPEGPLANRDYVWAKQASRRDTPQGLPDRAGFGLPLPFGKRPNEIVSWGAPGADNRRASPLLIHIARFGDRFLPVLTHLPARVLPDGEAIRFKGLSQPSTKPTAHQRSIVGYFLDDLESKNLIERIAP